MSQMKGKAVNLGYRASQDTQGEEIGTPRDSFIQVSKNQF